MTDYFLEVVAVRGVRLPETFGSNIFVGYFLRGLGRRGYRMISATRTPLRVVVIRLSGETVMYIHMIITIT